MNYLVTIILRPEQPRLSPEEIAAMQTAIHAELPDGDNTVSTQELPSTWEEINAAIRAAS